MKQTDRTTFLKQLPKLIVIVIVIVIAIATCPGFLFAMHHERGDDFAEAWSQADNARLEAAKIDNEWGNTGKILEQAKKAHDAGDKDKAMALVATALEESKDALAQAEREKIAWQARVPTNK